MSIELQKTTFHCPHVMYLTFFHKKSKRFSLMQTTTAITPKSKSADHEALLNSHLKYKQRKLLLVTENLPVYAISG